MDSSNSSSSHYSTLLATVAELRSDLEKTMKKIQMLEEQNNGLSKNYQIVKDDLIDTRKKYNEVKDNYLSSVSEKIDIERKYETILDQLSMKLRDKTKEFDLFKEKFIPQDIDQLRIKVQEELEMQHKQQLLVLESEIEKQRDMYYSVRRECDRNKVEFETVLSQLNANSLALRNEKNEIESDLRNQLLLKKGFDFNSSKDDKIRQLKAQISELNHIIESTRDETIISRKLKEDISVQLETLKSSHDDIFIQNKSKIILLESERLGLQESVSKLNLEMERKDTLIRNLKQNHDEKTYQYESLSHQHQELEKKFHNLKNDYEKQFDMMRGNYENERIELHEQVELLTLRCNEREDQLRMAQRESTEMQIRAETIENELRRSHQYQLQESRKKYVNLEVETADLKNQIKMLENQHEEKFNKLKYEKDFIQSEITRLTREKEILHNKYQDAELQFENQKRKLSQMKTENQSFITSLESQLHDSNTQVKTLEQSIRSLKNQQVELQRQLINRKELNEILDKKVDEKNHLIEELKKEFQTQMLDNLNTIRKKMLQKIKKEKKRAEVYKSKVLQYYDQNNQQHQTLSGEDSDN